MVASGCKEDAPEVVRVTIGREGGQATSHDGVLTLLFQPGALAGDTEIEIAPSDRPPMTFGQAYRVKPDVDMMVPIDVTYRGDLPTDPTTAAVAAIHREDFELGSGAWIGLPVLELDEANGLVAGVDTELSLYYALLERTGGGTTTTTSTSNAESDPTMVDPTTTGMETDTEDPETSESETTGPLSYAGDIEPVFADGCSRMDCHDGSFTPNLLDDGYNNIINVPSPTASADFVVPGDAAASYLMHKMNATHTLDQNLGGCGCNGLGGSMPLGEELLPQATRNMVRDWINGGAMP